MTENDKKKIHNQYLEAVSKEDEHRWMLRIYVDDLRYASAEYLKSEGWVEERRHGFSGRLVSCLYRLPAGRTWYVLKDALAQQQRRRDRATLQAKKKGK